MIYWLLLELLRLGVSRHRLSISWLGLGKLLNWLSVSGLIDLGLTVIVVWSLHISWLLWLIDRVLILVNKWFHSRLSWHIAFVNIVALLLLSFRSIIAKHCGEVDLEKGSKNLLGEVVVLYVFFAFIPAELML